MADVLAEFLVKLGYSVDQGQQNRFVDGLKETHSRMEGLEDVLSKSVKSFMDLGVAAGGTAIALATALSHIAMGMAGMSFQAQRVGSSASDIHALGFAFTQAGGSADDANAALEAYATTLRETPALEQTIKRIYGVTATDHAQQLVQIGAEIRRRVEAAGPVGSIDRDRRLTAELAQAQKLTGQSQQQVLLGMRPQTAPAFQQDITTQNRVGVDWNKAAKEGEDYRKVINEVWNDLNNLKVKIGEDFTPGMTSFWDGVKEFLEDNDKQIGSYITNTSKNLEDLKGSLKNWWEELSPKAQGQVETGAIVGGAGAALFGGAAVVGGIAARLGIPGGRQIANIGALNAAIVLLTNDYATWQRTGGKDSLIDWQKWEPGITKASDALQHLNNDIIGPLADKLGVERTFIPAFEYLAAFLVGPMFLGVLKEKGLWAFFTFLQNPLSILTALGGDTPRDTEREAREAKEKEEYEKTHPDYIPGIIGQPGEPAPSGGMINNLVRRLWRSMGLDSGGTPPRPQGAVAPTGPYPPGVIRDGPQGGDRNLPEPIIRPGQYGNSLEAQRLEQIMMRESGGRDIWNFMHRGDPEHRTASGPYMITDTTWRRTAPLAGVDINQYPHAIGTPADIQHRVAVELHSREGDRPWKESEPGPRVWPPQLTPEQLRRALLPPAAPPAAPPGPRSLPGLLPVAPAAPAAPAPAARGSIADDIQRDLARRALPGGIPRELGPRAPPPSTMPQVGPLTFNSEPHITVNGVQDPRVAADHVERASARQNSDVLRRLQTVYA